MDETIEEKRARYEALLHAMQTGVAVTLEHDSETRFLPDDFRRHLKHLRVGVNSAMIDTGAMALLLVRKGIITEAEYYDALIETAEREVKTYERNLRSHFGVNITLG